MKPLSPDILNALNESVSAHLSAIELYSACAALFARNGYSKLAGRFTSDVNEEREHLNKLLGRIAFFDSAPVLMHKMPVYPHGDVVGIIAASLSLEESAAGIERRGIITARQSCDEVTAALFAENLEGSEASIMELEAIQGQIRAMTLGQYLSTQL